VETARVEGKRPAGCDRPGPSKFPTDLQTAPTGRENTGRARLVD